MSTSGQTLTKAFIKQTRIAKDQGRKQTEALQYLNPDKQLKSIEDLFPNRFLVKEAIDEIHQI